MQHGQTHLAGNLHTAPDQRLHLVQHDVELESMLSAPWTAAGPGHHF
jgi:hypothetical protein